MSEKNNDKPYGDFKYYVEFNDGTWTEVYGDRIAYDNESNALDFVFDFDEDTYTWVTSLARENVKKIVKYPNPHDEDEEEEDNGEGD